nr:MAG TPA: hypothetical protein [Caudoviricetes sp.]
MPFVVSKKIAHSVFDDTAGLEKKRNNGVLQLLILYYI